MLKPGKATGGATAKPALDPLFNEEGDLDTSLYRAFQQQPITQMFEQNPGSSLKGASAGLGKVSPDLGAGSVTEVCRNRIHALEVYLRLQPRPRSLQDKLEA